MFTASVPHPLALKIARDYALDERTAFFVPVYGVGDKIRFYSYMSLFKIFNGCDAWILIDSEFDASLLTCYPDLKVLRVASGTLQDLYNNRQVIGGKFSPLPGPMQIFPTWHGVYLYNQAVLWQSINQKNVSHDLAIKQILHVPAVYKGNPINLPEAPPVDSPTILLAPFNVSTPAAPCVNWMLIADHLTKAGFRVLCNVARGPRQAPASQDYGDLFERYECLDVPIESLLGLLGGLSGVISVRSGLSDLVSLSSIPSVTLVHSSVSRFWDMPNYFGKSTQIIFDLEPREDVAAECARFMLQHFTRSNTEDHRSLPFAHEGARYDDCPNEVSEPRS